jgi:hypothetical protein
MGSVKPLLSFLLMITSGWVHRHQLMVIEFLQAENRLLKERLRGRRIQFTDAERALLARKAKAVGRKALFELDTIVPRILFACTDAWSAEMGLPATRRRASRHHASSGWCAWQKMRWTTRLKSAGNLSHKVGRGRCNV